MNAPIDPKRDSARYERRAWLVAGVMILLLPAMLWFCWESFRETHNSPVTWLPNHSQPRQALLEFAEEFQTEDMIIVSWVGCDLDDTRLPTFAEIVSGRSDAMLEQTNLSGAVLDGFHAIERLIYEAGLSRVEATERLQGLLVGNDGKTSCALLPTRFRSNHFRNETVDFILNATREAGVADEDVRLAGAFIEGVAIDRASTKSFKAYALPSALIISLICWLCLRSWRLSIAVLGVAGFSGGTVIAVLPLVGIKLNAVLVVMAPLIMVLSVSAGVHLVNYYLDEWRKGSPRPVSAAIAAGWWPCTFCTLTTAIGMASLMLSEIVPVRQFGALTSLAVLGSLGLMMLILPGAMHWHLRTSPPAPPKAQAQQRWGSLVSATSRGWAPVVVVGLMVMLAGGVGVSKVQTSVSVMNLLNDDHWLVSNYRWLEDRLGPLVPIEVLLRFDEDCELDDVQRVEVVRLIEDTMHGVDELGSVFSGATFLPYIPEEGGGIQATFERTAFRREMPAIKEQLQASAWLAQANGDDVWRISARVPAFGDENYDQLMATVRRDVNHAVAHEMVEGLTVSYTGLAPVVSHAQKMLLNDLFRSLVAAVGLVAIVLMFVFRSVRAGLLAMVPNMFPSVVLFGGMGLMGVSVDIGTVMTASVALGIAVDDTIHFLTWFRREHQRCGDRREAVRRSFSHSASAMMQTTAVCGLGLSPFVLADFVPTAQFAWMMIALLGLAIVGDLVLLPALLSSPSGATLEAKKDARPDRELGAEAAVGGPTTSTYSVASVSHEHVMGR